MCYEHARRCNILMEIYAKVNEHLIGLDTMLLRSSATGIQRLKREEHLIFYCLLSCVTYIIFNV